MQTSGCPGTSATVIGLARGSLSTWLICPVAMVSRRKRSRFVGEGEHLQSGDQMRAYRKAVPVLRQLPRFTQPVRLFEIDLYSAGRIGEVGDPAPIGTPAGVRSAVPLVCVRLRGVPSLIGAVQISPAPPSRRAYRSVKWTSR